MAKSPKKFTYEDKFDVVNEEIRKRKNKWFLDSMPWIAFEDVEQILADNEEALDDANEIANLIAGAGGNFDVVDEDELEAELQALNGNVNKNNSDVLISKMPNVPTHKVEKAGKDVDKKIEKKRVLVTA